MKRVVSVSLGTSKRDFREEVEFLGQAILVERVGVDGSLEAFAAKMAELDGKVDALGIGGADKYLFVGRRRYVIRDIARCVAGVKTTPVLDGSGLKNSIERETVRYLQANGIVDFTKAHTLLTSALDRFGLAEELVAQGGPVVFGDLMFALGLGIPIRRLGTMHILARVLLPVISRLPFTWVYPTGSSQETVRPRFGKYFAWADVIAGDYHYIRRRMPDRLDGKTILSNTTREKDLEMLRERGVARLVTSTPEIGGKSPGTNVFEAIIVALSEKPAEQLTAEDYMAKVHEMGWQPRVVELQELTGSGRRARGLHEQRGLRPPEAPQVPRRL